jgi:transposase-like protein
VELDTKAQPKRWSAKKKLQVVLRLLGGETIDDLSREFGVEVYRIEEWRQQAHEGIESKFKERVNDPLEEELNRAKTTIGSLSMEVELLKERVKKKGPFRLKRLK